MRKQIVRFSITQTSKVLAAFNAVLMIVFFVIPSAFGYIYQGDIIYGLIFFIIAPLLLWLLFFIGNAIALWCFNLIAPWVGGIEFDIEDKNEDSNTEFH